MVKRHLEREDGEGREREKETERERGGGRESREEEEDRMAGGRRGLVAPQNTFLENIVRRSNGKIRFSPVQPPESVVSAGGTVSCWVRWFEHQLVMSSIV
ncbi:unnamed protein product [Pleuronectes platessa]|uniref:Uncharacterized protein n=1 Tax=Pleuronectes platessa TaxID=8262 RepID=A0A9N7U377_PLEPL|nr:unnamed protein product [Pleuronectes platessa]